MAPDLDLRPGEPTRSTMGEWLRVCTNCGAAAPDLTTLPPEAKPVVASPEYVALWDNQPAMARAFLCWSLICERAGATDDAAEAMLQAAWTADDSGNRPAARDRRLLAAALWGQPADPATAQRMVDALRRAGAFDRAATLARHWMKQSSDPDSARILRFQLGLIAARDTTRHGIASALPPPARSPHVTHGRRKPAAGKSLWRRLFGG
jgi:hypothetical protein